MIKEWKALSLATIAMPAHVKHTTRTVKFGKCRANFKFRQPRGAEVGQKRNSVPIPDPAILPDPDDSPLRNSMLPDFPSK